MGIWWGIVIALAGWAGASLLLALLVGAVIRRAEAEESCW